MTAYRLSKHPPLLLNLLFKEQKTPRLHNEEAAYYTGQIGAYKVFIRVWITACNSCYFPLKESIPDDGRLLRSASPLLLTRRIRHFASRADPETAQETRYACF